MSGHSNAWCDRCHGSREGHGPDRKYDSKLPDGSQCPGFVEPVTRAEFDRLFDRLFDRVTRLCGDVAVALSPRPSRLDSMRIGAATAVERGAKFLIRVIT